MRSLHHALVSTLLGSTGVLLLPQVSAAQTTAAASEYDQPAPPPRYGRDRAADDRVQVGAQVGWLFGSEIEVPGGDIGLNGDWAYTGNVDVRLSPLSLLELRYTYFPTEVEFHPFVGQDAEFTELDVHYMQAGIQSEVPVGVARPFFGLTLGAAYFNPEVPIDGETYFSTTVSAGLKLLPAENVGVRLQASLPYTWTGTSSALFCGFGGCSYAYVGDGILQLDLAAGAFAMF